MAESDYRAHIQEARQEAFASYDKLVVSLAGGFLALSLTFVDSAVGEEEPQWTGLLLGAWVLWISSLLLILGSHLFSQWSLTRILDQIDSDTDPGRRPGGWPARATKICNLCSGVLLVAGIGLMAGFTYSNL